MNTSEIQEITNNYPELRKKLFARGFLFTDVAIDTEEFPFYGDWVCSSVSHYKLLVHPEQTYYTYEQDGLCIALVGHAYNPFNGEWKEKNIIKELCVSANNEEQFTELLNQLTGIFTIIWIKNKKIHVVGDATCMQTTFYGVIDENIYISSHTNLIGDIIGLEKDPFVVELSNYRFFKLFGNSLPGDITPFKEVKRLVPNHILTIDNKIISNKRFYYPHRMDISINEIVDKVSDLLAENMRLIPKKWSRPAISLTGGCDSKTTLACAKDSYDKYQYFSYISSNAEKVDAEAAKKICDALQLVHKIYIIPTRDEQCKNTAEVAEILNWNTGDVRRCNANDVRKRITLSEIDDFDVEVKSWASEIGRAYYSKRFNGRTDFGPKPTPRKCTTLYKVFVHNRKLVKKVDATFAEYLNDFFEQDPTNPIEWQEQFFWEFRFPSWNGLVITGEQIYSSDITIPYNNRFIIQLLLSACLNDRIRDIIYLLIRNKKNSIIADTGIFVRNVKHTHKRAVAEDIYYKIKTKNELS